MTESKRSNAAGEKYALRGIYGSEPYWPQEKLKICVTGAGGFIGARFLFLFFFVPFLFPGGRRPLPRDRAVLWRVLSLSLFSLRRERDLPVREPFPLLLRRHRARAVLNRFITLSFSFIEWSRRRLGDLFRGPIEKEKSAADSASRANKITINPLFKTTTR
jgi:hypothetical protein